MHRFLTPLCRRLYVLLAVALILDGGWSLFQHSTWHKERLYRALVSGNRQEQLAAAGRLIDNGGQTQLVRALKSDSAAVREIAANALWELWFHAAGEQAYRFLEMAERQTERRDFAAALTLLDHVTRAYPQFAEGWNRRATLYWTLGAYERSIADCRRVVGLNPDHFGAWQGMGLCQFEIGDLAGARHSLQIACRIAPHDPNARRLLQRCEEMLHDHSPLTRRRGSQLI